jgi:tetratricopeptide (TPR) repeat protein
MKTSSTRETERNEPFASFLEMQAAYNNLTHRYGETLPGDTPPNVLDSAEEFIARGRKTGMLLADPDERWDAQNMVNFWAKIVYRYRRAPGDEPVIATIYPFGGLASTDADVGPVPFQAPPEPRGMYVGRESFIFDLKQQLLAGRNIALCSSPGIGKTLIATKLAHDPELREKYPHGVLWAKLGEQPDVSGILRAWGEALNILPNDPDWYIDQQHAAKIMRQALARRRMLLIIDDVWQLDVVNVLKLGGSNCAHVVTTYLMSVALDFDVQGAVTVPGLTPSDGVRLFRQQAAQIVEGQEREVEELVEKLGNSPLALFLLANYCRLQPDSARPDLKEIGDRLLDNKQVIEAERQSITYKGARDDVQTPASLLATIDWCFEHLKDEDKYVLETLSFFPPKPNSFSDDAARYITEERSDSIEMLIDHGLLERTPPERYSLHRAVSEFLKRRAHEHTEHTPAQRMVHFFVSLVQQPDTTLNVLEQEKKNILAALGLAHQRHMWRQVIDGTRALFSYFDRRGLYILAQENLSRAKEAAENLQDQDSLADILLKLGEIHERRAQYADASEHLKRALEIATNLGDRNIRACVLQALGVVAMGQAEYGEAERYLNEALRLARELRDTRLECDIETRIGWIERGLGNFEQSRARTERALALALSNQYTSQIAELELSMGVLDFFAKNYETAKEHDLEGLRYAERTQDKRLQCGLYQALGGVEIELENFNEAEAHLMKSLQLSMDIGHRWYNGVCWKEIGELKIKQQLPNAAFSAFKKALDMAREVNSPELMGLTLFGLARVAALQGNYSEARLQGLTSLNIFQSIGHHKRAEVKDWIDSLPQAATSPSTNLSLESS